MPADNQMDRPKRNAFQGIFQIIFHCHELDRLAIICYIFTILNVNSEKLSFNLKSGFSLLREIVLLRIEEEIKMSEKNGLVIWVIMFGMLGVLFVTFGISDG